MTSIFRKRNNRVFNYFMKHTQKYMKDLLALFNFCLPTPYHPKVNITLLKNCWYRIQGVQYQLDLDARLEENRVIAHDFFQKISRAIEKLGYTKQCKVRLNYDHNKPTINIVGEVTEIDLHALDKAIKDVVNEQSPSHTSPEPLRSFCVVCQDEEPHMINATCGHFCMCNECSKRLSNCPICRSPIQQLIRVFQS